MKKMKAKKIVKKAKDIKIMVVELYRDEDVTVTLIDDGQDFKKLFREFNRQDKPDTNPDCLGFTAFMESKGVRVPSKVTTECLEYHQ